MKKLYINYEFSARVHGIYGHVDGTEGYAIIEDDGSFNASEYAEAINRIFYILKTGEDCILMTFGNGLFISQGLDKSYGRLIRHWSGAKLGYVVWEDGGDHAEVFENDGSVPDRKLARSFLDRMLAKHKEVCMSDLETVS